MFRWLSTLLTVALLLVHTPAGAERTVEPKVPLDVYDTQRFPMPHDVRSVQEVIRTGVEVPLQIDLEDPLYRRPVYLKQWHSTNGAGRWSNLVERRREALHRLHSSYMTASIWYDFTHDLGIAEELMKASEPATKSVFDELGLVVFQAKVQSIRALGNQVVIVATPQRTGLTVLSLPLQQTPSTAQEPLLIQLVTPDGYEYDYNVQENMKGFHALRKQKPDL